MHKRISKPLIIARKFYRHTKKALRQWDIELLDLTLTVFVTAGHAYNTGDPAYYNNTH